MYNKLKQIANVGPRYLDQKSNVHHILKNCLNNSNSVFMSATDENEIQQVIMSLRPKKSSGCDNLIQLDVMLFWMQMALLLAILINRSIVDVIAPQDLKIANIIHVCKSNAKNDISNYRPISILLSISKTYWKINYIDGFLIVK